MEDDSWTINNVEVPELSQLPTLIDCKMISNNYNNYSDDIVAVVRVRTEDDKKGKKNSSKWKLIGLDLSTTKAPPSSPDMLIDSQLSFDQISPSKIITDIFLLL